MDSIIQWHHVVRKRRRRRHRLARPKIERAVAIPESAPALKRSVKHTSGIREVVSLEAEVSLVDGLGVQATSIRLLVVRVTVPVPVPVRVRDQFLTPSMVITIH